MALFKRRHFRVVLLEWLAYGMAFGAIAIVGACQAPASDADGELTLDPPAESSAEIVTDDTPEADPSIDPAAPDEPLPEPEFSEAIREEYNPVDLARYGAEQLSGEEPVAVTEALLGATEPMEGRYSESSEAEVGNERAVVLFTQDNLPDDSVQAIRTRAEFERIDGPWQLIWAGEQYRCREGRGQQDWAAALCS